MNSNTSPTIVVLGTGLIGAPAARNLRQCEFTVRTWNRTAAKAQAGVRMDAAQAGLARFERALAAGHGEKDIAASYLADVTPAGAISQ